MDRKETKPSVKVLIMCGGKGTRMWPISNLGHPKQFESLLGKKSMFRHTVERVLKGFSASDIYIATSVKFAKFLKKQAPEVPGENFILEPAMRDNLGAVGLATAIINHRHPDSVMIIIWGADHLVQDEARFLAALKQAARLAGANPVIVHVDTPPTYPTVHNGWIKIGKKVDQAGAGIYQFLSQVEKPDLAKASRFYRSKSYLIHTGYMATKPSLLLGYYRKFAPRASLIIEKIARSFDTPDYQSNLRREYPRFEKISVDYGLFEKLPPMSQWELPTEMGWVDVGTWELLYHGLPKDEAGNVIIGRANLINVKNSLIIGKDRRKLGVIGVEGMIVVDSEAGLLVCPLEQAPQVKTLYNQMFRE